MRVLVIIHLSLSRFRHCRLFDANDGLAALLASGTSSKSCGHTADLIHPSYVIVYPCDITNPTQPPPKDVINPTCPEGMYDSFHYPLVKSAYGHNKDKKSVFQMKHKDVKACFSFGKTETSLGVFHICMYIHAHSRAQMMKAGAKCQMTRRRS
uniref:ZP domain-containing protein n=1 Tax=Panagrellus redivivus TaxID=6233 RepID=A0A7E4W9W3_PANRE